MSPHTPVLEALGLLFCWQDIARRRGIEAADREMRDNCNGWTPEHARAAIAKAGGKR